MSERNVRRTQISVTTVGGAGLAAGPLSLTGRCRGDHPGYIDYHASCPATADVTIAPVSGVGGNILAIANSQHRRLLLAPADLLHHRWVAITYSHSEIACVEPIQVTVAQADALTNCVVVTIWWKEHSGHQGRPRSRKMRRER